MHRQDVLTWGRERLDLHPEVGIPWLVQELFLFLGSAYGFWSYEQELKEGLNFFSLLGIGTVFLVGGS